MPRALYAFIRRGSSKDSSDRSLIVFRFTKDASRWKRSVFGDESHGFEWGGTPIAVIIFPGQANRYSSPGKQPLTKQQRIPRSYEPHDQSVSS